MASYIFKILSPIVNCFPEIVRVKGVFFYKFGRLPSIDNPITFNEKVQWRKIYDRDPIFTVLADKLAVKNHISSSSRVVVPRVLWSGNSLQYLDVSILPDNYVIKANHASGTNFIVRNGDHPSKSKLSVLEKDWRATDISKTFVEWAYSQVPVRFFVEEFLDFEDVVPIDYKFWVFHGEVKFLQVDLDRFTNHKRAFYSLNGKKLDFRLTYPDIDSDFYMPDNFSDMVHVAEEIAHGLDFVRIDLYSDNEKIYFGECTMYPGGGYEKFVPQKFDEIVGNFWRLSAKKYSQNSNG